MLPTCLLCIRRKGIAPSVGIFVDVLRPEQEPILMICTCQQWIFPSDTIEQIVNRLEQRAWLLPKGNLRVRVPRNAWNVARVGGH